MSHKDDHPALPGPAVGRKKMSFWNAFFVFLGILLFLSSGMLRTWLFAAKDSYVQIQPNVKAAGEQFSALNPGVPEFGFIWNGKEHKIWGAQPSGKDWAALTGVTYGSGGSGADDTDGGGSDQPDQGSDDLPPQTPPQGEDPAATYAKYQTQFIALVGGIPGVPDFSLVTASNVKTARQLLSNMKATGVNLVEPQIWNDEMEARIKAKYEACFPAHDLSCVRAWGPVQIAIVNDPPGLREWLFSIISDSNAVNDLVSSAVNTNAQSILDGMLDQLFQTALVERIQRACAALGQGEEPAGTALDVQWCFSGQTVQVWIEEKNTLGNWVPKQIGGAWGVLGEGDHVVFVDAAGKKYRVTAEVAMQAVKGLTFDSQEKYVEFPDQPALWDTAANPWIPGQPIP